MLTATRLKITGAVLCATVLGSGHALTAHADTPTDLADAAVAAAEMQASDVTTWTNPNVTCGPEASGQGTFTGVSAGSQLFAAEEAAEADVTCFSFTNKNYTLNATLSILEYDAKTKKYDITVCSQAGLPFNAVDGAATVRFPLMQCFHNLTNPSAVRTHLAEITWSTGIPGDTPGVWDSNTWTMAY